MLCCGLAVHAQHCDGQLDHGIPHVELQCAMSPHTSHSAPTPTTTAYMLIQLGWAAQSQGCRIVHSNMYLSTKQCMLDAKPAYHQTVASLENTSADWRALLLLHCDLRVDDLPLEKPARPDQASLEIHPTSHRGTRALAL